MAANPEKLSDREKAVLRLLVQGFDTKSAARELGLSVHAVNERLRSARNKLQVTSSREAARLLFQFERPSSNFIMHKGFGVAARDPGSAARRPALIAGGVVAMTFIVLAGLLIATPISTAEPGPLPNWTVEAALGGGMPRQRNELRLDGNRLLWNSEETSEAHVRAFLALVGKEFRPQPPMILSYGAGVSPQRLQRMRLLIDDALNCKPATCFEVTGPSK